MDLVLLLIFLLFALIAALSKGIKMDRIFIDSRGRYYKALEPKEDGDAEFNHPTPDMFQLLTEVPITRVEFERLVMRKLS